MHILGNRKEGLVFVISAPAGSGKTTLAKRLYAEFPGVVIPSISCTTRPRRNGEKEGIDYHFLSQKEFDQKVENGDFLEFVQIFNNSYGTMKSEVIENIKQGKNVVLVVDTSGAMTIKNLLPAISIFIMPPSLEALEKRLKKRDTESIEERKQRLALAEKEIAAAKYYNYVIVNDDVDTAYQVLRSIIIAEEHRNTYDAKRNIN